MIPFEQTGVRMRVSCQDVPSYSTHLEISASFDSLPFLQMVDLNYWKM